MLLETNFQYDTDTKVLLYFDQTEKRLRVLGLSSCSGYRYGAHRPDGGMIRAFHEYANEDVRRNTDGSPGDFCDQLQWAYARVCRGEPVPTWLSSWLSEINPYAEDLLPDTPTLQVGTAIRFYRDDGPRGSWVWKDTVGKLSVLLRPSPVRVEL